jgi:lysophospholipase L1-like esterase
VEAATLNDLDEILPVPRRHQSAETVGGRLRWLPGVAEVGAHVIPFADAWDESNLTAARGDPSTPWWCAIGDSAAQGVGASSFRGGWAGRLDDWFHEIGSRRRLINLSVSGARTGDVLAEQLPRLDALGRVLGPPVLVAVAVGANDVFRTLDVPGIRANLAAIAAQLPPGSLLAQVTEVRWSVRSRMVNRHVRLLAEQHALRVVDVNRYYHSPFGERLAADRFHPNDRGYDDWARAFIDALASDATTPRRS